MAWTIVWNPEKLPKGENRVHFWACTMDRSSDGTLYIRAGANDLFQVNYATKDDAQRAVDHVNYWFDAQMNRLSPLMVVSTDDMQVMEGPENACYRVWLEKK